MILKKIQFVVVFSFAAITFLSCNKRYSLSSDEKPTIGILPFADFPQHDIDSVKKALELFYELDVVVLDKVDLPKMAYTEIRYPRYRGDSLLEWMSHQKYDSVDIMIGLTNRDISITKYKEGTREIKEPEWQYKDFGIFGLGRLGGDVCVVSSNRLSSGVSKEKYYTRLTRISCHEIGHVLGLPHCPNKGCIMNDANESIKTIDTSEGVLCEKCKERIE